MANKRHYDSRRSDMDYGSRRSDMDYGSRDGRREDSMMLREDRSAPANLPQDVKYHAWPKNRRYANYYLDDTIRGVDNQIREDEDGAARHRGGNKW